MQKRLILAHPLDGVELFCDACDCCPAVVFFVYLKQRPFGRVRFLGDGTAACGDCAAELMESGALWGVPAELPA